MRLNDIGQYLAIINDSFFYASLTLNVDVILLFRIWIQKLNLEVLGLLVTFGSLDFKLNFTDF